MKAIQLSVKVDTTITNCWGGLGNSLLTKRGEGKKWRKKAYSS